METLLHVLFIGLTKETKLSVINKKEDKQEIKHN